MSFKTLLTTAAGLALAASLSTNGAEANSRGGGVLPPFAYIQFCVHHASACKDTKGRVATIDGSKVAMTATRQHELTDVNSSVNAYIHPRARGFGERWTAGGKFGDCNSYALTKRAKLIAAGWPSSALSLTVVKTSWGEGHLVLSVHTSAGVMVLDNLSHTVRPLSQVPYHLVAMQGGSALQWGAGSESAVNAVADNLPKMTHPRSRASYRIVAMQSGSASLRGNTIESIGITGSIGPSKAVTRSRAHYHIVAMRSRSASLPGSTIESIGITGRVGPSKAVTQLSEVSSYLAKLQSALKAQWNRHHELLSVAGLPQLVGSFSLVFEAIRGHQRTEV